MKHLSYSLGTFIVLMSPSTYAFFCPSNFNQIEFGYTVDQVQQQCGKPDKTETIEAAPNEPQEWSYYNEMTTPASIPTNIKPQGTVKTTVMFDKEGKAISINSNGVGVGETTICGGQRIALGDTPEKVKAACGEPMFISKNNAKPTAVQAAADKVTTLTYNSNPPKKLIFEGGKLTRME